MKQNACLRNANLLTGLGLAALAIAVNFPVINPAYSQTANSLRNPLIPGANYTEPMLPVQEQQMPPPGNGNLPLPVEPGMPGNPMPPVSRVPMPPTQPFEQSTVNSYAAPYLSPPRSTPGADPGMLPGTLSGYKAPAIITTVNGGGGIFGYAPTRKWHGQVSRDLGLRRTVGSQTTDFGQSINQISPATRSESQDGPRTINASDGSRQKNLANAQETTDLYGNRTLFKGPNLRAVLTISQY